MPFRQDKNSQEEIVGIGVDITERCNRRCPTCYVVQSPRDMTFNIFKRIVDQGKMTGFEEFYILGGEPTLHKELFRFIEYAKANFPTVYLVTNLDKLSDRDFCQAIADSGVLISGQKHIVGNSAQERKIERLLAGCNSVDMSQKAWENVTEIFLPDRVCVQCCITKPVVDSGTIYDVFRWARERGFDPVMEFTKEGDGFKRNSFLDVSSKKLFEVLLRLQRIDQEFFGLPGANILTPQAYGKTCHMVENSIHFLVDGSAVPCVGHHNLILGNIMENSLEEILDNPIRQAIKNPKTWIFGYCRDECKMFSECTGGCRGSAFDMTGCPRASFYYCPHIPRERFSLRDMCPPTCVGCILEDHPACGIKV